MLTRAVRDGDWLVLDELNLVAFIHAVFLFGFFFVIAYCFATHMLKFHSLFLFLGS